MAFLGKWIRGYRERREEEDDFLTSPRAHEAQKRGGVSPRPVSERPSASAELPASGAASRPLPRASVHGPSYSDRSRRPAARARAYQGSPLQRARFLEGSLKRGDADLDMEIKRRRAEMEASLRAKRKERVADRHVRSWEDAAREQMKELPDGHRAFSRWHKAPRKARKPEKPEKPTGGSPEQAGAAVAATPDGTIRTPVTAQTLAAELSRQAALDVGVPMSGPAAAESAETEETVVLLREPRHVHIGLLVLVMVLLGFGLVMLFSASMTGAYYDQDSSVYYFARQFVFMLLGLFLMFVMARIDPKLWNKKEIALIVYGVTTFLLILVLVPGIGILVNGQRRWLPLVVIPGMQFQPSEIAKLATVYCGGVYYSSLRRTRSQGGLAARSPARQVWKDFAYDFVIPVAALLLWFLLISQQSHMSSILIISLTSFVVFLAAGIRPRSWLIFGGILLSLLAALLLIFSAFRPQIQAAVAGNPRLAHLITRLDVFSGAAEDDEDATYQSDQALIGIGSGGFSGVGIGMGRQKFNFLPEIHNDYVFANICEEMGFLGGSLIITLFLIFFILGIQITLRMRSIYTQVLAAGFSSLIVIQAFLSIAVNLMVIPPTGISLPLFSYGGTSNLFFMVDIAFLLTCSKYGVERQKPLKFKLSSAPYASVKGRKRRKPSHVRRGLAKGGGQQT